MATTRSSKALSPQPSTLDRAKPLGHGGRRPRQNVEQGSYGRGQSGVPRVNTDPFALDTGLADGHGHQVAALHLGGYRPIGENAHPHPGFDHFENRLGQRNSRNRSKASALRKEQFSDGFAIGGGHIIENGMLTTQLLATNEARTRQRVVRSYHQHHLVRKEAPLAIGPVARLCPVQSARSSFPSASAVRGSRVTSGTMSIRTWAC